MTHLVLMILAAIFFALGTVGVPWRVNWIAAGLFCLTIAFMLPATR